MSVDVLALQKLVTTVATGLSAAASAPAPERTSAVLQEALAGLEVLLTRLRDADVLRSVEGLSTLEKLEQQYGRALGRVIAALGGLPILESPGSSTLARMLGEDAGARDALAHLDPDRDAELLETLYDLFLPNRVAEVRARRAAASPVVSAAASAALDANAHTRYVIGINAVPTPAPSEPIAPDPDLSPEHHVSGVRRVNATRRARKR